LNFLFGGCFLSRFAFGDQPRQVPPDPRLSTLIRSHPNRKVTVPQTGTGHFRLRRKLTAMLGGEAGYDNVHSRSIFQAFCPAPLRVFQIPTADALAVIPARGEK